MDATRQSDLIIDYYNHIKIVYAEDEALEKLFNDLGLGTCEGFGTYKSKLLFFLHFSFTRTSFYYFVVSS